MAQFFSAKFNFYKKFAKNFFLQNLFVTILIFFLNLFWLKKFLPTYNVEFSPQKIDKGGIKILETNTPY